MFFFFLGQTRGMILTPSSWPHQSPQSIRVWHAENKTKNQLKEVFECLLISQSCSFRQKITFATKYYLWLTDFVEMIWKIISCTLALEQPTGKMYLRLFFWLYVILFHSNIQVPQSVTFPKTVLYSTLCCYKLST